MLALCDLAEEKGYCFIGSDSNGNNAYFVRRDRIGKLKVPTPQEGYVIATARESRDKYGRLTYVTGPEREAVIKGWAVYNTRTGKNEAF